MKPIKHACLLILLASLCCCVFGCATARVTKGKDFDISKASQIVNGKTTGAEVISILGIPQRKSPAAANSDGVVEQWVYSYVDVTAKAHNVPFSGTQTHTTGYKKILYVRFDKSGVVVNSIADEGPIDETRSVSPH